MFHLGFIKTAVKKEITPKDHRHAAAVGLVSGLTGGLGAHVLAKTEKGKLLRLAKFLRVFSPAAGALGFGLHMRAARNKEQQSR